MLMGNPQSTIKSIEGSGAAGRACLPPPAGRKRKQEKKERKERKRKEKKERKKEIKKERRVRIGRAKSSAEIDVSAI